MQHPITRIRHEPRQRCLTVRSVHRITPGMVRVEFEGDELAGFVSLTPDDHVKLRFQTPAGNPERRDYTPRRYDPVAGTRAIDFALHDAGPAKGRRLLGEGPGRCAREDRRLT